MGILEGGAMRLLQTVLYALIFCASAIILGIFSYFLAVLKDHDALIPNRWRAVEGISGASVLYCIFAILLTCCLGGFAFFGSLAVLLNVLFAGAFVAIAVLTRHGAHSCTAGNVATPLGSGDPNAGGGFGGDVTYSVKLGTACRLNKTAFALSIAGIALFLIVAATQILLVRNHKKDNRFGASSANTHASGSGRGRAFWRRRRGGAATTSPGAFGANPYAHAQDTEMAGADARPSHDTHLTGSTVNGAPPTGLVKDDDIVNHSSHAGYYTQPQGTGINPYGYTDGGSKHF